MSLLTFWIPPLKIKKPKPCWCVGTWMKTTLMAGRIWTIQPPKKTNSNSSRARAQRSTNLVHPDHDGQAVEVFLHNIKTGGWVPSSTNVSFPDTAIPSLATGLIGVHYVTELDVKPLELKTHPSIQAPKIVHSIWAPFNRPEFSLSFSKDNLSFNNDSHSHSASLPLVASTPKSNAVGDTPAPLSILYNLHHQGSETQNRKLSWLVDQWRLPWPRVALLS